MAESSAQTLARRLGDFAIGTFRSGAPADVRASVQQRILDICGLQLAALHLDSSQAVLDFVEEQGGVQSATIVGSAIRAPVSWAAFANGVLAHSLDFDDTHLPSILHPSATIVPAAIAAAEYSDADGRQLVDAVAVGIETVVRLGMAGYDRHENNSLFFEHGQHATSICGALGAAVSAGLLFGMDANGITDALGVSASMASGIIEANRTGGSVKRLHCGWAAHAGVTAAQLVARGLTGPPTVLEGRFGFFEAFLHRPGRQREITEALGERWSVPGIFFKPYPSNHFTHAGLDAARGLRERGLCADDVVHARLGVAGPTVRTIGEPLAEKRRPRSGYHAQFSGPYLVALGLLGGSGLGATLDDFTDERVQDPEMLALMNRIDVYADPECDAIYPNQFPAVLTVRTRSGAEVTEKVLSNRGGPERPLSDDELTTKFRLNALREVAADEATRIAGAVDALLSGGSVRGLMSLAPASSARPTVTVGAPTR